MAPSLSILPREQRIEGSGGPRVVRPEEMTAITVKRGTKAVAKNQDGKEHEISVPKGTIGYSVCPRQDKPGHIFAQLIDPAGNLHNVSIPSRDADKGAKHGLRADRPRVIIERAIQPLSTARAQEPASKAIVQMWHAIRDYFDSLKDLGLKRANVYEDIIHDEAKFRDTLNELIASFTPEAWNVIKTGCDIKSLLTIRPVDNDYPGYDPTTTVIYLLLYPRVRKPAQGSGDFAKYSGKSARNPHLRNVVHDVTFKNSNNNVPHYVVARTFGNQHKVMLPMMQLREATSATIAMAETTVCMLFRTWHPGCLAKKDIVPGATDADVPRHQALMQLLHDLGDESLKEVGYPLLHRVGCNFKLPLEEGSSKRREWLCYQVTTSEKRSMSVFRTRSAVSSQHGKPIFRVTIPVSVDPPKFWEIRHTFEFLESPPPVNTPLIVSVELMNDGKPHETPWYRGPHHGAWNNSHELHSFSLRVEWFDEQSRQWVAFRFQSFEMFAKRNLKTPSDQYHQFVGGDLSLNYPWVTATRLLQFFRNRRYTDPPHFLAKSVNVDFRDVVWDHMSQSVKFIPRTQHTDGVEPQLVSFLDNWNALEQKWPTLHIGERPSGSRVKCALCTCLTSQQLPSGKKCFCWQIKENELDPNEISGLQATAGEVAKETCQLCWVAYRRPCVWVKEEEFTVVPHPNGRDKIYTLPQYPGLAPVIYLRPLATSIPAPLPLSDYYQLKDEIEIETGSDAVEDPSAIDG